MQIFLYVNMAWEIFPVDDTTGKGLEAMLVE